MKKIGVVLSGCGVRDGSEIHEAVCALLAIDQAGCEAVCMAPKADFAVTDHLTMQETGEKRNILVESARIARGNAQADRCERWPGGAPVALHRGMEKTFEQAAGSCA